MSKCLNLIYPNKSDIDYTIHHFPDGHNHIELFGKFNTTRRIDVVCRICNAEDLFLLHQIKNILDVNDMRISTLYISYLFTARCDRRFNIGQGLDLKIVANQLQQLNACEYRIVDVHSGKLNQYLEYTDLYKILSFPYKDYRICFPDEGAYNRLVTWDYHSQLFSLTEHVGKIKPVICKKTRITVDGQPDIIKTEIDSKPKKAHKRPILVVDDLCDGGGTFIAVAEKLRELNPPKISIFVTHAIQLAGIERISKVFDEVFISNSYKDWDNVQLPSNVKVLKVNF